MKMDILVSSNHTFLHPLRVMLFSLFSAMPEAEIGVYFPWRDLPEEDLDQIGTFVASFPGKTFHPLRIPDDLSKEVGRISAYNGISIETYYRILAWDLLPGNMDRILWLDADMVVEKDLSPLWETDLGDHPFAVCEDILGILNGFHEANKMRLGIPREYSYFNAGVMLMNLDRLRRDGAADLVLRRVEADNDRYQYNDQDVLNETYYSDLVWLPWDLWNCPPGIYYLDKEALRTGKVSFASYQELKDLKKDPARIALYQDMTPAVRDQAAIVHYMGRSKPWMKEALLSTTFSAWALKYQAAEADLLKERP